eukprot:371590-Alexandrium_andersonii.AAC.1
MLREAPNPGLADSNRPGRGRFRPEGPAGTAASSVWNVSPFSMLTKALFGYVDGLTHGRSRTRTRAAAT